MYKILIVDDEKKEREGIELLIRRYQFELTATLASNGEEALKMMGQETYDILLTDIKMPFMDGIQLIREVQKRGMNPVCIIYSAYGEFEYAQNAISLGVLEYLLKPVKLDAFTKLFEKVIEACRAKDEASQEKMETLHTKEESIYQKVSWVLLNYLECEELDDHEVMNREAERVTKVLKPFVDFNIDICIPVLISCYSNLFSIEWEDYQAEIKNQFGDNTIIINNMDNQIIALLVRRKGEYRFSDVKRKCEALMECSRKQYQVDVFIILGKESTELRRVKKEYNELKEQLDYQFFASKSMMIVHDETYFMKKENDMIGLYFERILNCGKMLDYSGIKKEMSKVFSYIANQTGFSSIYIKYTFTDVIKKISECTKTRTDLIPYIERIYQAKTIGEVQSIISESLMDMEQAKSQTIIENRLVRMAKDIIYDKYGENDLNVSFIADALHVNAAYLSNLYKNETGQNLVKFITQYRLAKSKELLKQTNMRVSDVAERVGYLNVSYYISIFRNHEGCSPIQYRER